MGEPTNGEKEVARENARKKALEDAYEPVVEVIPGKEKRRPIIDIAPGNGTGWFTEAKESLPNKKEQIHTKVESEDKRTPDPIQEQQKWAQLPPAKNAKEPKKVVVESKSQESPNNPESDESDNTPWNGQPYVRPPKKNKSVDSASSRENKTSTRPGSASRTNPVLSQSTPRANWKPPTRSEVPIPSDDSDTNSASSNNYTRQIRPITADVRGERGEKAKDTRKRNKNNRKAAAETLQDDFSKNTEPSRASIERARKKAYKRSIIDNQDRTSSGSNSQTQSENDTEEEIQVTSAAAGVGGDKSNKVDRWTARVKAEATKKEAIAAAAAAGKKTNKGVSKIQALVRGRQTRKQISSSNSSGSSTPASQESGDEATKPATVTPATTTLPEPGADTAAAKAVRLKRLTEKTKDIRGIQSVQKLQSRFRKKRGSSSSGSSTPSINTPVQSDDDTTTTVPREDTASAKAVRLKRLTEKTKDIRGIQSVQKLQSRFRKKRGSSSSGSSTPSINTPVQSDDDTTTTVPKAAAATAATTKTIFDRCRKIKGKINKEDLESSLRQMNYSDTHIDNILSDLNPVNISFEELETSLAKNTAERADASDEARRNRPKSRIGTGGTGFTPATTALPKTAAAPMDAKSFTKLAEQIFANTGKINPTNLEITTQMAKLGETNHDIDEILTPFAKRGSINLDEFKNAYVQYKVEMELPKLAEYLFKNTMNPNPTLENIIYQMKIHNERESVINQIRTAFAGKKIVTLDEFKAAFVKRKKGTRLLQKTMMKDVTPDKVREVMDKLKKTKNATKIQSIFRGYKSRKNKSNSADESNSNTDPASGSSTAASSPTHLENESNGTSRTSSTKEKKWWPFSKKGTDDSSESGVHDASTNEKKSRWPFSRRRTDDSSGSSRSQSEDEVPDTQRKESTKEKKSRWPFSRRRTDDSSEPGVHDASTKEKKSRWSLSRKRTDESSDPSRSQSEDELLDTQRKESTKEKKSRWPFSRKRTDDSSGPSGSQSEDEVPDTQRKESTNEKKSWLKSLYQSTKKKKGQKNSGQGIKFSKRPTNDDDEIEVVPVGVNDRDRFRRKKNDNPRNRNIPDTDSEEKDDRRTRRTTDDTDPSIPSNGKWKQWYTEQDGVYYTLGSHVRKEKLPEWIQGVDWEVGKKRDEVENDTQYTNSRTNDSDYQRRDDEPDETQRDEDDDTESPSKPIRKTPEVWDLKMPIYLDPKEIQEKIPVPREELKFMSYKGKRMTLFYIIWSVIICIICFMGMVGWRKVENTSPMVRKDTLSCFQHPCILNKTHQSVHAFASDYMSMSQSISFQSPFMQTHVMNAEGISKMIPTWMSNGTTAYDVMDLCVLNERRMIPTWMSNGTTAYERHVETPDDKTMIPCTQTENFCPIVTRGQAETCEKWLVRIQNQTSSDTWPSNVPAAEKGSLCSQYAETYASQPYQAQIICKMMRSPRMSLAHVQNNNYNLFSTHNEMYLAGCLNVIIGVFSCAIALSVLRQLLLGSDNLDYFAYSDVEKQPGLRTLDGLFSLLMIGQAFIVVTVYFGLLTKTASENHQYVKSMLLPTGSIIITAMSGAVAVLLVACSPFYRMGSVKADRAVKFDLDIENPKQDSEDDEDTIDPRIQKYTTLSMNRYHRFLLTRNDLCLAYCNFVTFPILVLIVYVKYEWYSIDVHIQRAFFSAVAVGALNIVEVSVMGVMYLVTEMDSHRTRRKYANIWLFAHSNLINFTVQFVFVMSKMAIFIPTILELKQNIRWTYTKDLTDQYNGQKNGNQPLVAVMVSSFVVNHILYIVWNVISNLGFDDKFSAVLPEPIDKNLCTFLLMNMIVILVLNYTDQ